MEPHRSSGGGGKADARHATAFWQAPSPQVCHGPRMRATQLPRDSTSQQFVQIIPRDVVLLDQIHLPFVLVFLEPLFPINRIAHIPEHLAIDEPADPVFFW